MCIPSPALPDRRYFNPLNAAVCTTSPRRLVSYASQQRRRTRNGRVQARPGRGVLAGEGGMTVSQSLIVQPHTHRAAAAPASQALALALPRCQQRTHWTPTINAFNSAPQSTFRSTTRCLIAEPCVSLLHSTSSSTSRISRRENIGKHFSVGFPGH